MLYPILHRLEKRRLVEAYWGTADTGRKRKYYRLLQEGRGELNSLIQQWDQMNGLLQRFVAKATSPSPA